jgi:hypothetical protein
MVIIRTSAVVVSIQAVSPVSILKAGVGAAAGAVLVVVGAAAGLEAGPVAFTVAVGIARVAFCALAPCGISDTTMRAKRTRSAPRLSIGRMAGKQRVMAGKP